MQTPGQTFDIVSPVPLAVASVTPISPPEPTPRHTAPYGPYSPHPDDEKPTKKPHRKRLALILTPIVFIVGAAFYAAYGTAFGLSQTYLGTALVHPTNTSATLTATLHAASQHYAFSITYPDKQTTSYNLADAGVTLNTNTTITDYQSKMKHSGFRKYVWWRPMYFTVATTANTAKLDSFINQHASSANVPAVDAQLTIVNGAVSVSEAKDGSAYTIPGGKAYLLQNIARLKAAKLTLSPQHTPAAIQAKDLAAAKQKTNGYLAKDVSFTVSDQTVQASKADIGNWLDISPVPSSHTADVTVNSGKVQAYIAKLSAKYTRPAVSEIQTTDASGNTSVLIAGSDGIDVTNQNDAAKQVANGVQNSDKTVVNLAINHVAHTTVKAGDYDKWVVADLTTKRMYAYEHTTLVRSFLISAGAPKTPTVTGQYKIYAKYVSKDMRGKNADGSRYFQPHVHYVNFFYQDYAIHGNYWRPTSYFGNINSSHGCVGITDSDAAWLYNWAPIGTTVITHA